MKPVLAVCLVVWVVGGLGAQPWQGFTALTVSADGRWFATGGREGEILWWETATGEVQGRWSLGSRCPVVALAFAGSGPALAAAGLDGALWSLATPLSLPLVPTQLAGGDLASAPARWLASAPLSRGVEAWGTGLSVRGSPDGTITVTAGGLPGGSLSWQAHGAVVTGLALLPDGASLLSCSYDGTLALWDFRTGRLLGRL